MNRFLRASGFGVSAIVRTILLAIAPASVISIAPVSVASAQAIPLSQLATVSQTVAGTRIDITYRRPVARGRELFGGIVAWGEVWSPSSDTAAVITLSGAVRVNGERLPAGTYSIWAVPDPSSWTVIFSSAHPTFHRRYPQGSDALRVRATPQTGDHVESLAFYFPMVDADSARLVLHWGKTIVPLDLHVIR